MWARRIGTKRFIVIYSRGAFATSDERRWIKRRALEMVGGTVREAAKRAGFRNEGRKNSGAESRACGTDASSADKAAALQKRAPSSAKNTGGAYSLFLRKEEGETRRERGRGVQVPRKDERSGGAGLHARHTRTLAHASANYEEVDIIHRADSSCKSRRDYRGKKEGKRQLPRSRARCQLFTRRDNSACIYVTGNDS